MLTATRDTVADLPWQVTGHCRFAAAEEQTLGLSLMTEAYHAQGCPFASNALVSKKLKSAFGSMHWRTDTVSVAVFPLGFAGGPGQTASRCKRATCSGLKTYGKNRIWATFPATVL
eukprot:3008168-Rhodomonas_salina.1